MRAKSGDPPHGWSAVRFLGRIGVALIAGVAYAAPAAAEPLPRSVLILDQSEPSAPWGIAFRDALRLTPNARSAAPIALYSEVVDLGRFNSPRYEELLRTYLREKYRDRPVGVIIVNGSTALEMLLRLRAELWSEVPVVFAAVDELTAARLRLPPQVTGTTFRLTLRNAVISARAVVPKLKRIALVGDPFERQPFRRHFAQELPLFANELEIIDLSGLPMAEVRKRVAALPDDAAIIYTTLHVDGAGVTYISRDALVAVAEVANRPIVVDAETLVGVGGIGGLVAVPEPIGRESALLALRILNGEKASSIPITTGDFIRPVFDWRQLQHFGVSENGLPPGSEVRFRPQALWDQYRWQMIGIVLIVLFQAALIAWLLFEHQHRRRAETESRQRLLETAHMSRTATAGALSVSLAHELNQPLGAILSNAEAAEELLKADVPDLALIQEILADIRRDDQRAGEIIRRLRGLLRKSQLELQEFDLNDEIRDVLHMLDAEAAKRGVILSADLRHRDALVRAEKVHVQQVMLNLAMNGMDAMLNCLPGNRRLTFQSARNGSTVEVSVSDTGTGIPEGKLKGVFETFYTTKPQGTGLGLSIARTIIETYGGQIWAENRQAGGAVVRFRLPLAKVRPA